MVMVNMHGKNDFAVSEVSKNCTRDLKIILLEPLK